MEVIMNFRNILLTFCLALSVSTSPTLPASIGTEVKNFFTDPILLESIVVGARIPFIGAIIGYILGKNIEKMDKKELKSEDKNKQIEQQEIKKQKHPQLALRGALVGAGVGLYLLCYGLIGKTIVRHLFLQ